MSSGCLDDLQVLKASENKRDHRLLHELETLLNPNPPKDGLGDSP